MTIAVGSGPGRAGVAEMDEAGLVRWGRTLGAAAAQAARFVCLYGDLGSGKTTLVRAACSGAGFEGLVTSPTFSLVNRYEGPDGLVIFHADLYRLHGADQLFEVGWEELVDARAVVFVEWAERAGEWLNPDRWEIHLGRGRDDLHRTVRVELRGRAVPFPPLPAARC